MVVSMDVVLLFYVFRNSQTNIRKIFGDIKLLKNKGFFNYSLFVFKLSEVILRSLL